MINLNTEIKILECNPIRMIGSGDRMFSDYIAGVTQRDYYQPWETSDIILYQFLSNYENHVAELLQYGEVVDSFPVSLLNSYRNKTFQSNCKFATLSGKLFVYFENGFLPEANIKAGDSITCTLPTGTYVSTVLSIQYKSNLSSEGYLVDVDLQIANETAGTVEAIYNEKDLDLYYFNIDFPESGIYQVRVTANTGLVEDSIISEPLGIEDEQPETKELYYKGSEYSQMLYPDYLMVRVKGNLYAPQMSGEIETYTDDNGRLRKYRAVPQYAKTFKGSEIPGWMAHKLNLILAHDELKMDDVQWEIEDFGSLENIEWNDLSEYEVTLKRVEDPNVTSRVKTATVSLSVEPESLSFIPDGEAKTVQITSDTQGFELVSKPNFVTVAIIGTTITVTASENTEYLQRSGTIYIRSVKYSSLTASINCTQLAKEEPVTPEDYLSISADNLTFGWERNSHKLVYVACSGEFTIGGSYSGFEVDYIDYVLQIIPVADNLTQEIITGQIILTFNAITKTIDLTQDYTESISNVTPNVINAPQSGGNYTIQVTAHPEIGWSAHSPQNWISIFPANALGGAQFTLSISNNLSGGSRTGFVTVTNADNPANTFIINITQQQY